MDQKFEVATLGAGCFWCIEAVFQQLKGVTEVVVGYSGGTMENPTDDDIYYGKTGHAEVGQITFDPQVISFEEILDVFWHTHNPTTLNRQGYDVGEHYRSVIFYHDDMQKEIAEKSKASVQKLFADPIVTEIVPFKEFYKAAGYHQDFYNKNSGAGYCRVVIDPKLEKLRRDFGDKLKGLSKG